MYCSRGHRRTPVAWSACPRTGAAMSPLQERAGGAAAPLSRKDIRRIFYALMMGGFLSAVNQTIVASALPTIGRELDDFQNLSWVIIAYLLSSTVVAPLYGKLSDIHGRRVMMLVALGLFIAGSALSAVASSMAVLIAGRVLQGIGGGGITPMVQTTVADMVAPRERGRYQAYMGTAWIAAGVVGPVLGGVIADKWHWSWIFWLNVPLGLCAAWLSSTAMKRLPPQGRSHRLDIIGASLMILAAVALLLVLTSGGTRVPWISSTILVLLLLSIVFTLGFSWWLHRVDEPFLPLGVLANPVMRVGTTATSCALGVMTHAALLSGRAQAQRHAIRSRARSRHRAHHARFDAVGTSDDASPPLQDFSHDRNDARDHCGCGARLLAGDAAWLGDFYHWCDRPRCRLGISHRDRVDPKCSGAPRRWDCDRRDELLSRAGERLGRRNHGGDIACRPRRYT